MTELTYHTLDALRAMPLEALRALWELVPTDRQRACRAAYDRTVLEAGAAPSDALEREVTAALIAAYRDKALVPAAGRWVSVPTRVQDAARAAQPLEADEAAPPRKPSPKLLLAGGALMLIFIALLAGRIGDRSTEAAATPTPEGTPSGLAVEAQDDIILGGDAGREFAYPVSLSMRGAGVERVYLVQRRRVDASEWRYDANPDTASLVYGMSVRPVIGIPWSVENAAAFTRLGAEVEFVLTMNTGATLRYRFRERRAVRRNETDFMRQVAPGLALLLIGETDAEGLPTATRPLILADYDADGELSRTGEVVLPSSQSVLASGEALSTPLPFAMLDVQVIAVTTQGDRLTAQLRLYNGGAGAMRFTPDDLWLALGYAENPPGPRLPAETLPPFDLLPGQAADVTFVWAWAGEPYGVLGVGAWEWAIAPL
jgi:hypothetical protein